MSIEGRFFFSKERMLKDIKLTTKGSEYLFNYKDMKFVSEDKTIFWVLETPKESWTSWPWWTSCNFTGVYVDISLDYPTTMHILSRLRAI